MIDRFNKNKFFIIITLFIISLTSCDSDTTSIPVIKLLEPIAEIDLSSILSEPSGIVYNSVNNSFYIVSDTLPQIFEIDIDGDLLGSIQVNANDLEGITLSINRDTIYVVEESDNLVTSFLLDGTKIKSFSVDVSTNSINGLEGIAIDANNNIYVLNEKLPRYLVKLQNEFEISRTEITAADDISDVCYDSVLDCLWIISDESEKILKVTKSGSVISEWHIPFSKGEGITLVDNKIYVVRDSNAKMYIFDKPNS
jgi:uncharacterized protein YjiK